MQQKAFLDLIEPLKSRLFGFAYRMLRNREDAKDAIQELMLKLWNIRNTLETKGNIRTYAFTALYHDCIDRLRRQNRFRLVTGSDLIEIRDNVKVEQDFENSDLIRQIRIAMDNLPYKQKVILELRDFQDFDYEEIAKMMDMTVNAVRVTVARSRAAISEKMKKEISYETGTF
ncbi:MAG: sigma-70 family RNA polymerase sigma factor [Bacteroidia bacterium]|nr:sigma-70 family RNA polymerase sigma factor [Bacteroidia bacterium]